MNITEIFNQIYNAGMLGLAIIFLGLTVIAYPTLRYQPKHKKTK